MMYKCKVSLNESSAEF